MKHDPNAPLGMILVPRIPHGYIATCLCGWVDVKDAADLSSPPRVHVELLAAAVAWADHAKRRKPLLLSGS